MYNLNCPVTSHTSYGIVALNIIENTENIGVFPIGSPSGRLKPVVSHALKRTPDFNRPSVRLFHQFSMAESIGRGPRIGFPIFELDRFSSLELNHLSSLDKIIVCSEWAKGIVSSLNIETWVAPLGVDRTIFSPVDYTPDNFIFFSAGKWEIRKSQNEIVDSFNRAFQNNENVELWLSMHNPFYPEDFIKEKQKDYLNTSMGKKGKIKFVGPFDRQEDLARIMNSVSCGVFPSKAEGWGLGTLEMMSCGKPVIVTDYAGHTEYCNKDNSVLLPINGMVDAYDGKWFHKQGMWCSFDEKDLIESMIYLYKKGNFINKKGIETAEKFSWKNTAEKIIEGL